MARTTFVTKEPVVLEGFQAVLKPSKFGYSLSAVVDTDIVDQLEDAVVHVRKVGCVLGEHLPRSALAAVVAEWGYALVAF